MTTPAPAQEKEWHVMEMCNELAIVHKLPGELRIIAAMTCPGLDEDTMHRYADRIVDALNNHKEENHE